MQLSVLRLVASMDLIHMDLIMVRATDIANVHQKQLSFIKVCIKNNLLDASSQIICDSLHEIKPFVLYNLGGNGGHSYGPAPVYHGKSHSSSSLPIGAIVGALSSDSHHNHGSYGHSSHGHSSHGSGGVDTATIIGAALGGKLLTNLFKTTIFTSVLERIIFL